MGTRSLTFFYDNGMTTTAEPMLVMYRQFDGYIEGHGRDLAKFLKDMTLVNGYTSSHMNGKFANGMSCLAAQFIAKMKNGIGNIYIVQPNVDDNHCENYRYYVHDNRVTVEHYGDIIFDGTWPSFYEFCNANVEETA